MNVRFGEWIPIKTRPLTDEERDLYGDNYTCMMDCPTPNDGDEILISRNNGKWVDLVVFVYDGYVGDENGNDWTTDVDAWMPLPKGYVAEVTE